MIRIWRGKEPEPLAAARRKYMARACLAWANGASARIVRNDDPQQARQETIEFQGYDVARESLYRAQHQKCAYCERQEGLSNQPVEHFRPKGGADRKNPVRPLISPEPEIDDNHYFWLAWSWENLFFACTSCNGRGTKGNHFPLLDPENRLPLPPRAMVLAWPSEHYDRKGEKAMLVDPSLEDPMNFIQWLPTNPGADWKELRWTPISRDPDKRGDATIEILGLRTGLPDQVSASVGTHVVPKMKRLRDCLARMERTQAEAVWGEIELLFAPSLPYLAATYDAIEWFLEQMGLTDLQTFIGRSLEELRPGTHADEIPSTELPDPSPFASLPVELVLRIRAEAWDAEEAVHALCSHSVWDDIGELAKLLGYAESTFRVAGQQLVKAGKLTRTPSGGFGPVTP